MKSLMLPLLLIAAAASCAAGLGLQYSWSLRLDGRLPAWILPQLLSAAIHLSWLICAARRRAPLLVAISWYLSLSWCRSGLIVLHASPTPGGYALVLESIALLLALSLVPHTPWSERLARWRRTRAEVAVQLRMGDGLLPWIQRSVRQLLVGSADIPLGTSHRRFLAELADAESRLRLRLYSLALPEQLRQSIQFSVVSLVGQAEATAARQAVELEQQALSAMALCREQCEALEGVSPQQKDALADQCEVLFTELLEVSSTRTNSSHHAA